jgi:hypothetical protein
MTTPTSLSEYYEAHEDDLPQDVSKAVRERIQRAFYAGALAAHVIGKAGPEARDRVLGECIDFGRGIGRS